ncbi:MAG: DNA-processing protein DprA [Streptococcaceae bacterium]|jgi:DNA processing protein|nr:DNA-processing protein DprA [Streptococcaceae bacterium]
MLTNYEIFRLKKAGMTNLGVNKLIKFYRQHEKMRKLSPRQMAQIAQAKSIPDFIEKYRNWDNKKLRDDFRKFSSFSILDEIYPEYLKEIYNPPTLLFYQGNLEYLRLAKLSFVGARDAGDNGSRAVQKLIKELRRSFVIVSGLAKGIDALAHIAAIKSGTPTIAVIGTGLDVCYPSENQNLQKYISDKELILSEYALGEKALKFHFPERNRIIAGLSHGVVVVEAKMRSGSLITAERAMEEGRDVFAVPGVIADGNSEGCHHLIKEGAKLISSGQDILDEYFGNF